VGKSSELLRQELRQQESGEENKLQVALKARLIKLASGEELSEALRYVMVKVGLRSSNFPDKMEKVVLLNHIIENFGGNTVEEIRLAFEMGISGKLSFLEHESVIPFENFSCLYFSSVMNAYRRWSAEAYRHLESKVNTPPEQKIFTQDELDDAAREMVEVQYQLFLKKNELKNIEANQEILIKDNLIKSGELVIDFFTRKAGALQQNIYVKN
jgi:hypothetical protein